MWQIDLGNQNWLWSALLRNKMAPQCQLSYFIRRGLGTKCDYRLIEIGQGTLGGRVREGAFFIGRYPGFLFVSIHKDSKGNREVTHYQPVHDTHTLQVFETDLVLYWLNPWRSTRKGPEFARTIFALTCHLFSHLIGLFGRGYELCYSAWQTIPHACHDTLATPSAKVVHKAHGLATILQVRSGKAGH